MANRKEIGYGSQGSEVKELQSMLRKNGYNLDVDGIFGNQTLSALKNYQKKNGLAVDGIVGVNTWGKLYNVPSVTTNPSTTTNTANKNTSNQFTNTAYTPSTAVTNAQTQLNNVSKDKPGAYQASDAVTQAQAMLQQQMANKPGAYQASDAVNQAQAMLQQQLASKPGAYQSQWQAGLDAIMDKILNREKFSYDMNADALYQQYKDQYTRQGQQAMMDTMGQAQAMTGGYGNSYAQTVGQQVYQGHMQQLNDRVPELYQLALDQYNREGEEMYNQYGLMADRESMDYDRYRDSVADWNTAYDQAYQQFVNERNFDYGQHRDQVSDWNNAYEQAYQQYMNERDFDYGQHRDAVSDWNNAYEQAYQKYQDERNFDYGQYADDRDFKYGQFVDDRNYQYQQDRDAVADQQWQSQFNEAQRQWQSQFNEAQRQWQAEFDEAKRQYDQNYGLKTAASSSSSSTPSSTPAKNPSPAPAPKTEDKPVGYNNGNVSDSNIKRLQNALGVTADGKWGPASQAAAQKKWGTTDAAKALNIYNAADNSAGRSNQFTGSTYEAAVKYMKANGVASANASSAMTAQEWTRRKNAGSTSAEVKNYSSYKEYLADFVEYQMSKK